MAGLVATGLIERAEDLATPERCISVLLATSPRAGRERLFEKFPRRSDLLLR